MSEKILTAWRKVAAAVLWTSLLDLSLGNSKSKHVQQTRKRLRHEALAFFNSEDLDFWARLAGLDPKKVRAFALTPEAQALADSGFRAEDVMQRLETSYEVCDVCLEDCRGKCDREGTQPVIHTLHLPTREE